MSTRTKGFANDARWTDGRTEGDVVQGDLFCATVRLLGCLGSNPLVGRKLHPVSYIIWFLIERPKMKRVYMRNRRPRLYSRADFVAFLSKPLR